MRPIKQITLLLVLLLQVFVLGAGSGSFETGTGPKGEAKVQPEWVSTNGGPVLRVLPAHDNTGEMVAAQDADGLSVSMEEGPLDAPCDGDLSDLTDDLGSNPELDEFLKNTPERAESWMAIFSSKYPGVKALRTDVPSLQKFDDLVQANNLGLDENGIKAILDAAATKSQQWDFPENVLDAVNRSSDAAIPGMAVKRKQFSTPSEGSDPFVLKNAKQYQKEASGDAGLSFEVGGRSFDDVASDGKLIDRKYGHGSSVFNPDGTVKNQVGANKIIQQATEQINAANGQPIKWEVSTELGAVGIKDLFDAQVPLINIEVVHVDQQKIIN